MNTPSRPRPDHRTEEAERLGLTALLPAPPVPGLRADRELMLKEAMLRETARTEESSTVAAARAPRPRRRTVRFLVPAIACALAVGGVVAVNLTDTPGRGTPDVVSATPATPEAARLLDRIALAAGGEKRQAVADDRFVYIESKVAYAGQSAGGGPVTLPPAHSRQVWLSADGSRPGLLREEGEPDSRLGAEAGTPVYSLEGPGAKPRPSTLSGSGPSVGDPTHAYVASLPTDPDALLKLIREETGGSGQDPDQRAFTAIGDLLAETWAPPRVGAALYTAAGKIPGVTVVGRATDAAGREGVAVARTSHGQQTQWIFDRTTYAFLGERTVLTEAGDAGPAGTVVGSSAVLTRAAVDRAGETPAPTTA
ncbi:CU044_5270 family protein [Streptomyces sp. BE147]|uniref:CU044_5270 family protein n=1 Tax=unclassified Streptomyces TaxID=2593676 RepID=UPI002E794B00|nr:CU044_5270 family protein [Streptomyces sp. BE147]MEE1739834.1 CU044_5270 family protein [Streptomyces sp. BE147]